MDAAVKEVNELLGEAGEGEVPSGATVTTVRKELLCVERRCVRWSHMCCHGDHPTCYTGS